nr:uncharacterized protein LOC125423475 [Ziziphus jujuba var. spinosa]
MNEVWKKFKELLKKCPQYEYAEWVLIDMFYNGLNGHTKTVVDNIAYGSLMAKTVDEAYALLEEMVSNSFGWPIERSMERRPIGVHEVDVLTNLTVKVDAISHQLASLGSNVFSSSSKKSIGKFPSDTEANPRECKAITLRSGKLYQGPTFSSGVSQKKVVEKESSKIEEVKDDQAKEIDEEFSFHGDLKKKESTKKIHINIPFVDALEQMPNYANFMKEVMSSKRNWDDNEAVKLTEGYSAIIQRKIPQKLKDPDSFMIPCNIGGITFDKALCDLGASINLMPLSIFKRIGIGKLKHMKITLQMVDRSLTYPYGIIEDVLVKVDKFIFPVDFVILDMKED